MTASLFLFRDDESSSNCDSDSSSDDQSNGNKFPAVSQFSPVNKKETKATDGGFGDSLMSLLDSKINNIKFDHLGESTM